MCPPPGKSLVIIPQSFRRGKGKTLAGELCVVIYYSKRRRNVCSELKKENYYLDIAETVLERSTCLRRQYGAIIVRNDEIVATGYNGAPRGRKNCSDLGRCVRVQLQVPRGERYELCRSVHAEANAIISASRNECIGADLYLVGHDARTGEILQDATSCSMCRRMIINAGIKRVVVEIAARKFTVVPVQDWIDQDDTLETPV